MLRYSLYLIGSSLALLIGSVLLLGRVPLLLTVGTLIVIGVLLYLAFAIETKKSRGLIKVGVILAFLSVITSSLSPAHLNALSMFGKNTYLTGVDVLMVLGFYAFPLAYIVDWAYSTTKSKV